MTKSHIIKLCEAYKHLDSFDGPPHLAKTIKRYRTNPELIAPLNALVREYAEKRDFSRRNWHEIAKIIVKNAPYEDSISMGSLNLFALYRAAKRISEGQSGILVLHDESAKTLIDTTMQTCWDLARYNPHFNDLERKQALTLVANSTFTLSLKRGAEILLQKDKPEPESTINSENDNESTDASMDICPPNALFL